MSGVFIQQADRFLTVETPFGPDVLKITAFEGEEALSRLWFDTHVHDPRVLELVMAVMGRDRLVMGTNFAGWDQHAIGAGGEHQALIAANAKRLLRAT